MLDKVPFFQTSLALPSGTFSISVPGNDSPNTISTALPDTAWLLRSFFVGSGSLKSKMASTRVFKREFPSSVK